MRDCRDKIRLLLHHSPESVRSEYLHEPKEPELFKPFPEIFFSNIRVLFQFRQIAFQHPFLEGSRVVCTRMMYEGDYIIIYRSAFSSLEINEIRLSVPDHDISGVEVSVEECRSVFFQEVIRQRLEILLKQHFIEFDPKRFQKAVFEIVQVEHYHLAVIAGLMAAVGKVKPFSTLKLYLRQESHRPAQKIFHLRHALSPSPRL